MITATATMVQEKRAHERAQMIAKLYGEWYGKVLDKRIAIANTMATFVYESDGKEDTLMRVLEHVYEMNDGDVISLQFASKGIVQYAYPEQSENKRVAPTLDDIRTQELQYAKKTGKILVLGPVQTKDGKNEISIQYPIYLGNHEINDKNFWGFASVTVDMDEMLREVSFSSICEDGYQYCLTKIDDRQQKEIVVSESKKINKKNADVYRFIVPGYTMSLYVLLHVSWKKQWIYISGFILMEAVTILIVHLCILYGRLQKRNLQLLEISQYDSLTGLRNRHALQEDFDLCRGNSLVVIMMDLDKFKSINDTYGHEVGDAVLKKCASQILAMFPHQKCYRYGGDEFLLLIEHLTLPQIERQLQSLEEEVGKISIPDCDVNIEISYGYEVGVPMDEMVLGEMINHADAKLYEMKQNKNTEL